MKFLFILLMVMMVPLQAHAQIQLFEPIAPQAGSMADGSAEICGIIHNKTDVRVRGSIATDKVENADGIMVSHTHNFVLDAGNYISVCSEGPFFEGQRLELKIRTLFPVFTCKTRLGQQIDITFEEDETRTKKWDATCW